MPDAPFLQRFDDCFGSPDPAVRETATRLAEATGQALASLVATLYRGDEVNRAARPEWADDVWTHWATVRQVKLGGGLVSVRFGDVLARTAQAYLPELGVPDVQLELAGKGEWEFAIFPTDAQWYPILTLLINHFKSIYVLSDDFVVFTISSGDNEDD